MIGSRRPLGLLLAVVFAIVAVAGVVAAVRNDPMGPLLKDSGTGSVAEAREGVCQALDEAAKGRADAARRAFVDRAHQPLHDLAATTARRDREVAARLLEAKQRVERDFENGDGSLVADLRRLGAAADRAIAVAGGRERGPCGTSEEVR